MAFSATMATSAGIERAFSLGPIKIQFFTYSAASADTSGTITVTGMSNVKHVQLDGSLVNSALPTYSGNVVTLAFVDPAATVHGTGFAIGN
jgi:hypothetical protein